MEDTITINGVTYVRRVELSERVIVRTRNAGVHVGKLVSRGDGVLVLANANRIWRWRGAKTLSEMAMHGVVRSQHTRIAERVPTITLTEHDVCEVINVADGVDLSEVWND